MNIRYVLCDLDGTLLKNNTEIREEELETIEKVRKKGVKFVVCTGRAIPFCYEHLKTLGVIGKDDEYVIASSGSSIVNGKLEPIDVKAIDHEDLCRILDFIDDHDIFTSFSGNLNNYFLDRFRTYREELAFYDNCHFYSRDELKEVLKDETIVKTMSHIFTKEPQDLMKEKLMPVLKNCEASSSYMHFMDINRTQDHKDKGLTYFCRALGCLKDEVLSIGDGHIDRKLLAGSGIAACPVNASDEIKETADYISPFDCNHGAVSDILERYILKEE